MDFTQAETDDLFVRLLKWLLRRVGARTLVGLLLLGLVLVSVVTGISQVTRRVEVGLLSAAALLGMLLGWWLGRGRSQPQAGSAHPGGGSAQPWAGSAQPQAGSAQPGAGVRAGVLASLSGLVWTGLSVGRLWGVIAGLAWQGLGLVVQAQGWRYGDPLPDLRPLQALSSDLSLRLGLLVQKVIAWLAGLLHGKPPFDPLAASLLWGLVLWDIGAWSGWWLRRRRQPLWAVLPAAGLLCSGLAFSHASPLYLFPVLAGCLGLMAWSTYERRQTEWEQQAVDTAEGLTLDLGLWGMAVVMGISSVAYGLATFSPTRTVEALQRMLQPQTQAVQRMGQSLGLEARPTPTPPPPPPGVLPRKHLIGAGPGLSQRVVMVVSGSDPLQARVDADPAVRPDYYWRSVTYDYYTGRGWMTSATDRWSYQPGEVVSPTLLNPSRPITLTVQVLGVRDEATLQQTPAYFAGELVSLDREFAADWRTTRGGQPDLFRAWLPHLPEQGSYHVQARLLAAGEQRLRQAGAPPPDWIAERYLALPANLSARVRSLGQALAGSADNPYDRAKAIEASLRRYPYTLDLPPPPGGKELSEYFLFDLRRGFCDYYATAMVVLARAGGLPARLAVGYAQGTYDPARQAYVVTEADAHSWPEIYFSGVGWVAFEPTGGRAAIERPLLSQAPPEYAPAEPASGEEAASGKPSSPFRQALQAGLLAGLKLLAGAVVFLALGWLLLQQIQAWRLHRMAPGQALAMLYQCLRSSGLRLGLAQPPGQTPYELAGLLSEHLRGLVAGKRYWHGRLRGWLEPAPSEARRLVELYAQAAYSPHPPAPSSLEQALVAWRRLERRVWLARLYHRIARR